MKSSEIRNQFLDYFKMKGHAELVARQKPAFEQWVRSVRFNGARLGEGEQSD